jgi:AraC family transcriptional activator of pobA
VLIDRLLGFERPVSEPGADDRLLRRFLQLADEKLRERWRIEQYVDALGTTPYLLNRATRRAFGKTAIEVVRDRAVAEAKRLLLFSKAGAGEIGFMLGFDDAAHFGRFFQRRTGLSPSAWRRRHIGRALDGVR